MAAVIATSVAMGIRLLILIAILFGIRVTKRQGRINREINLAAAVVLILLGLVLMDGAFAYVDSLLYATTILKSDEKVRLLIGIMLTNQSGACK